jgi:hypothetical protein
VEFNQGRESVAGISCLLAAVETSWTAYAKWRILSVHL